MKKQQLIHYLLGFVDGEGCFHISLKKQKSAKMRWVLDPIFHVTQNSKSKSILYKLQRMFECGVVIKKHGQPNTMQFVVQSRRELIEKIIPFFKKHPLIVKKKDFEIFAEVVEALDKHAHRDVKSFKRRLPKIFLMNGGGKFRKYNLSDVMNSLGSSETIRQTRSKLQKS